MGQPKAWLDVGGTTSLQRIAALLCPVASEVVVVAAVDQELPAVDARIVRDRTPDLGPLPALALGLETIESSHAFVLACDTPLVRPDVLAWLDEQCRRRDADAVIPIWNDRPQPLVAVYHRRIGARLAALIKTGERRMQRLTAFPSVHLAPAADLAILDPDGSSFRVMNTPAEYAAIRDGWLRDH